MIHFFFACFFQGAGTAAHLMLEVWPWIQLVGWEIDPMVKTVLMSFYFVLSHYLKVWIILPISLIQYSWKLVSRILILCNVGYATSSTHSLPLVYDWLCNFSYSYFQPSFLCFNLSSII
jgi:hypothetical protein